MASIEEGLAKLSGEVREGLGEVNAQLANIDKRVTVNEWAVKIFAAIIVLAVLPFAASELGVHRELTRISTQLEMSNISLLTDRFDYAIVVMDPVRLDDSLSRNIPAGLLHPTSHAITGDEPHSFATVITLIDHLDETHYSTVVQGSEGELTAAIAGLRETLPIRSGASSFGDLLTEARRQDRMVLPDVVDLATSRVGVGAAPWGGDPHAFLNEVFAGLAIRPLLDAPPWIDDTKDTWWQLARAIEHSDLIENAIAYRAFLATAGMPSS